VGLSPQEVQVTALVLALHLELAQEAYADFGLFDYCRGWGVPHNQAYGEMLGQIVLAETGGLGSAGLPSITLHSLRRHRRNNTLTNDSNSSPAASEVDGATTTSKPSAACGSVR
jgi:hypothetical protein